ncbi:MAG: DUF58 domain-containing protein [Kiritimatiellae bacterium]|nr:DUF58 domain-containing protein [Kiritimatiellia bacterium]
MQASSYRYLPPSLAESVHRLGIRVRRPVRGRGEGLHRSPEYGASVEFAEYRPYTPGDAPNRIDWPVYARSDRYLVRRSQEETSLNATILLDTSESLAYRAAGPCTKLEYACFLAAGLMYALVGQGDAASLFTFTVGLDTLLPPIGTLTGLRAPLDVLERLRASGRSDIEAALMATAERIRARSLVICISDFLQPAERIAHGVRRLAHDGHNLIMLHVLDGGERHLDFSGVAELRELETGRRLTIDVEDIREAHARAAAAHSETLGRACAEALGDYHLLDTREPVELALLRLQGGKS